MKNSQEINEKIIDILLKKAEGFKYFEEQYEYGKEEKSKKDKSKYENLSFFENYDRGKDVFVDDGAKMKLANEENKFRESEGLVLIKKKVTSHYIPPDMLAIKILLEIFGKEAVSDFEKMTDEELFKFKKKILEELKNEDSI